MITSSRHHITDDSGFLALLDPDAYASFVSEDWSVQQLFEHFMNEIQHEHLLLWSTGTEETWTVEIAFGEIAVTGWREITGPITATNGRLLLTNYESVSMAAQFSDVSLPEAHHEDLVFTVEPGRYCCRIIQRIDPDRVQDAERPADQPDFILAIERVVERLAPWNEIPWMAA